jgi:hypothetical protein
MMGYESLAYYGAAGSTAATLITNMRNLNYDVKPKMAEIQTKGDGTTPPVTTHRPTGIEATGWGWNMLNKTNDTTLTALLAAALTGASVAIRVIRSTGKLGFDSDVFLSARQGLNYDGEQTIDFTVEGLDESNRTPLLNS